MIMIFTRKKKKGTILDLYISVSRVDMIFEDRGCDFKRVNWDSSESMVMRTDDCSHEGEVIGEKCS